MRGFDSRSHERERLRPFVDRARGFSGWDLSAVSPRPLERGPPWDYAALVREHAAGAETALDMGTGGGELLARLRPYLPDLVAATEAWPVNVPVARKRLAPLGVALVRCWGLMLPFADESFDLVINRHDQLDSQEIARVLHSGGRLVTQQVGRNHWRELRRFFPRMTDFGDLEGEYVDILRAYGLDVWSASHDHRVAYASLGELVYLLAVMPWTVYGFDLDFDLDALLALEAALTTAEGLVLTESRFAIVARRPV